MANVIKPKKKCERRKVLIKKTAKRWFSRKFEAYNMVGTGLTLCRENAYAGKRRRVFSSRTNQQNL